MCTVRRPTREEEEEEEEEDDGVEVSISSDSVEALSATLVQSDSMKAGILSAKQVE